MADAPGQLHSTLGDAITIWSGFDKVQVEGLTSSDVLTTDLSGVKLNWQIKRIEKIDADF